MEKAAVGSVVQARSWIRSRSWDSTFIIGSGVLVGLPLLVYYAAASLADVRPDLFRADDALHIAMYINLAVAGFIGGPHMYATFTMTLAERKFRRRFPGLVVAACCVPVAVIVLAVYQVELLMTTFFTWASIHVLHQLAYIVGQYQRRSRLAPLPLWSRAIDYTLALSCLHPIASWRLLAPKGAQLYLPGGIVLDQGFYIGDVDLSAQLPAFLHGEVWLAYVVWVVFGAALAAFVIRTVVELVRRTIVWPRTLLLAVTTPIAFVLPTFDNMDVAFQGFNLWHSFQYLGLVYLINAYRKERGEISNPLVHAISGFGNAWKYYTTVLVLALGTASAIAALHFGFGFGWTQVYYCVVLSVLLVHYLFDHAIFLTGGDSLSPVTAKPAAKGLAA